VGYVHFGFILFYFVLLFKNKIMKIMKIMKMAHAVFGQMVGPKKATFGEKVVGAFLAGVVHAGVVFYGKELAGIAKASGTSAQSKLLLRCASES
jgi:hypothetical protein